MKRLGGFDLQLKQGRGSKMKIPVEVFVDYENTIIELECNCCPELLERRLPGGVLIPIATALKTFFKERGMRNTEVRVNGTMMRRTYKGVVDATVLKDMQKETQLAVTQFTKKRRGKE
ncbi:MAG: hypothetical protein RTU30_01690 [Candidatus Thorarchaeota archaeon]